MQEDDYAAARRLPLADIPVVDLSADPAEMQRSLYRAVTGIGFFYLVGHGIAEETMERAFAVAQAFFALPEADKATVRVNQQQRGWMAGGLARLEGSRTHDLKEVFFWGREVSPDDPDLRAGLPLVAMNQWPDQVFPDLKRDLLPYYRTALTVGRRVLAAIAAGLGCPKPFFDAFYDRPLARGQLVYYPPSQADDEAAGRFGVAPHSDFGVLTLLLQDNRGGLQVRNLSGEWIEAPPIPGSLICNIGDLLQRWSNDRLVSTLHRVINRSGAQRYSIPVFYDPNSDARIDPCDLGIPVEVSRYDAVEAGAYIAARNRQNFTHYKEI